MGGQGGHRDGQLQLRLRPGDQLRRAPAVGLRAGDPERSRREHPGTAPGDRHQRVRGREQHRHRIGRAGAHSTACRSRSRSSPWSKSFPTVTANTGALIVDLPAVQQRLVSQGTAPLGVTEWWLATTDHQIPPGLSGALPPGSAITGAAEATAALTGDPLSAVPQQALLALAAAAALLAITGFWVSIAANVRQRRAENALLAALGVSQRSAALQLCLEKLMLSVPSAVLGVILGTVVARLLVPAVTLNAAATQPVPPPVTLFDLPQTPAARRGRRHPSRARRGADHDQAPRSRSRTPRGGSGVTMNAHTTDMNTRRLTGMGAVATLALAVLVFGCVLGATAGPREALKSGRRRCARQSPASRRWDRRSR